MSKDDTGRIETIVEAVGEGGSITLQGRRNGFLERHGIPLTTHHASGHAYLPDLQRFANAVAPKRLVPIHSFAPERFREFFEKVELHSDGDWWEV